ncbi:MAG: hypothetical protein K8S98_04885 [Planctomycetes bacterium]|nr:hypothetical protein [Planctomycetota bacterium]
MSFRSLAALACCAALAVHSLAEIARATTQDPAAKPAASAAPTLVPVDPDYFHPDHQPDADGRRAPLPQPSFGGRVIVRIDALPPSLNFALDGSAVTRRMLYELHETLLGTDWETGELVPDVADKWEVEDTLILQRVDAAGAPVRLVGEVSRDGEDYIVRRTASTPTRVPKADVRALERATVVTFHLRRDVHWQDGEPFDASDVVFSASIYANPRVRCDNKRPNFDNVRSLEKLDAYTVRFTLERADFQGLGKLADLCLLPAHRYDLSDPDHARFDPDYVRAKQAANPKWKPSADEQGDYINDHPCNRKWVGLGPYRLSEWADDYVEAKRWDGYFAPESGGFVDTIRWRFIANDDTANEALLAGDIDFNDRLGTDQYFGEFTQSKTFLDRCYKGYLYADTYGFIAWNLQRKLFADVNVRRALAMLFDYEGIRANYYRGQAIQVTSCQPISSPAYDWSITPLRFDPARADELLTAAGWYDRDGDGLRDKDGEPFAFELAINTGSKTSETLAARFQEELAKQGIRMRVAAFEWSTFQQRCSTRNFDAAARGWVPPPEVDPEGLWHSKWANAGVGGSNFCGYANPEIDRLIEVGQHEVDDAARYAIWHELGRRIYADQPYLFLFNPARKFALSKSIHGFQALRFDPCYAIRRWYYPSGTPGTRSQRAR